MTVSPDEIIRAAHLACESYFTGEFKTKRSIRQDMSDLRALVDAWMKEQAKAETVVIHYDPAWVPKLSPLNVQVDRE